MEKVIGVLCLAVCFFVSTAFAYSGKVRDGRYYNRYNLFLWKSQILDQ